MLKHTLLFIKLNSARHDLQLVTESSATHSGFTKGRVDALGSTKAPFSSSHFTLSIIRVINRVDFGSTLLFAKNIHHKELYNFKITLVGV